MDYKSILKRHIHHMMCAIQVNVNASKELQKDLEDGKMTKKEFTRQMNVVHLSLETVSRLSEELLPAGRDLFSNDPGALKYFDQVEEMVKIFDKEEEA